MDWTEEEMELYPIYMDWVRKLASEDKTLSKELLDNIINGKIAMEHLDKYNWRFYTRDSDFIFPSYTVWYDNRKKKKREKIINKILGED